MPPVTGPVALYLQDAHSIRDAMGYVAEAEAKGFSAVWQADSRLVRDAIVPMSAFAAASDAVCQQQAARVGRVSPPLTDSCGVRDHRGARGRGRAACRQAVHTGRSDHEAPAGA